MNWHALRIAIVGPLPPPAGGMAGQTQQLAELLRGEGSDVTVIQTNAPYCPEWIAAVRGLRAVARLIRYVSRLWSVSHQVEIFHVMANSGWSWHLFAAPAIWIGRLRGVRVVINYRGGEAMSFLERSSHWVRPSLRAASVLAVPSGFLQQVFARFGFQGQVIPNVVDLSRFRPETREMRQTDGSGTPCIDGAADSKGCDIIFVPRNLELIYDNATALRAFALVLKVVPRSRLVIAGSGPEESNLKALANDLGIAERIEFTGRLDRAQMAGHYATASIMLNPSRIDNMPNSVLEALASGVPVVSTDVGGIPFIVSHESTALLVPAGDERRMAEAIVRVLQEPDLAQRLAAAGLVEVQRYAWPRVRDTLGSLYQALLVPTSASKHPA